jgi:hypothetical protein
MARNIIPLGAEGTGGGEEEAWASFTVYYSLVLGVTFVSCVQGSALFPSL